MQGEDYCGVGVNEFTAGAQFTDYPRAADADDKPFERKYPYIIHSEMNALFQRYLLILEMFSSILHMFAHCMYKISLICNKKCV